VDEFGVTDVIEPVLFLNDGIDPRVESGEVAHLGFNLGLVERGSGSEEIGAVTVVGVVQNSVL
jgi:hypothetical protein